MSPKKPEVGDMLRCERCQIELTVVTTPAADKRGSLSCCGQTMVNITEPTVRSSQSQSGTE